MNSLRQDYHSGFSAQLAASWYQLQLFFTKDVLYPAEGWHSHVAKAIQMHRAHHQDERSTNSICDGAFCSSDVPGFFIMAYDTDMVLWTVYIPAQLPAT